MNTYTDRVMWVLGLSATFLMALLILLAPAPWLHDFAEWLFQARVLALKLIDPESVRAYVLAPYPVPNSLAIALLGGLTLLFPTLFAGKLYLLIQLLAWVWLLTRYARRFIPSDHQGAAFLVLLATVALSSFYWYGFISYQLGLWLLLLFLLRSQRETPAGQIALFGIGLFLSHAMVALVWGVIVVAWAFTSAREGQRTIRQRFARFIAGCLPLLPTSMLALWYLAGRLAMGETASLDAQMSGLVEGIVYKGGYPLILGGFRNFLYADGQAVFEDWPWIYWTGVLGNAVLLTLLVAWGVGVLWNLLWTERRGEQALARNGARDDGMIQAAMLLALFYLLAPYGFFGLINPGGRVLLPWLLIAVRLAPSPSFRWWRWAAWPAALGLALTLTGYAAFILQTSSLDQKPDMPFLPATPPPAGVSVFAFNEALYANARFKYFNYRLLVNGRRFEALRTHDYQGLGFRTGPILDERRPAVPSR